MSQTDTYAASPQRSLSPLAGVLSYLVPGLGQIIQGRFAKGLLFFFALNGMFFYGQYLGNWQNVYWPQTPPPKLGDAPRDRGIELLLERARFAFQFFIGVAAWPAVWHQFNDAPADPLLGVAPPDPPAAGEEAPATGLDLWRKQGQEFLKVYQRRPNETELNNLIRNSDKRPDLGVMYTIIAGVLNILVIYDAFAGPAVGRAVCAPRPSSQPQQVAT